MLCCEVFVWCVVLWKMLCCEKFLLCCEIFCVEVWQIHATVQPLNSSSIDIARPQTNHLLYVRSVIISAFLGFSGAANKTDLMRQ